MNTNEERDTLKNRLKDKKNREAFVSATVSQTIPMQMKALRLAEHRNWTQKELAQKAGVKQAWISNCENPKYDKFSLATLKKFAAAFDVGLIVRFAPFSELVEWEVNMSSESLEVPSFGQDDPYFQEANDEIPIMAEASDKVVIITDYLASKDNHLSLKDAVTAESNNDTFVINN